MRILVLLLSLSMPLVAWFSQNGTFGADNGTMSDRYPTLLVAAGYAFAIWGLIFVFDVIYGVWQATGTRREDETLTRIAPAAAGGFALTAAWMPLFSMGLFWLCLIVIFGALACLVYCAQVLSRDNIPQKGQWLWAWTPLSLHAGWLSVAAFLNLAQAIVAYKLLPTDNMLPWSLALFAIAAVLLLVLNGRMRGNVDYAGAAVWGLVGVYFAQAHSTLAGAGTASWVALAIAVLLVVQTLWLRLRNEPSLLPTS
ncbi:MAG: hypothetical protein LH470_02770 [Lysobacter sp.]|nr:hypothetical protein [Lysobacter sp.]